MGGCAQISPRKSFQLKRSASCGDTSLIEAAASVAWQNLELYSSEELDELPVDLVQRLLDKSIEAGKLKLAILQKFTRQPLYHMDLTSVNEVTDEWLVVAHGFALHHLSLAFCSAVRVWCSLLCRCHSRAAPCSPPPACR